MDLAEEARIQRQEADYDNAVRAGRLVYQATLILKEKLGFTSEMCVKWITAIVEETPYKDANNNGTP